MGHSALLLEALHRRQRCTNKRLECGTRDVKIEHIPPTWHGIGYHFGKEREGETGVESRFVGSKWVFASLPNEFCRGVLWAVRRRPFGRIFGQFYGR